MKITMIGHATLYIEAEALRILADPVLYDPHQEGLFTIYPARHLDVSALPPYDVIILSHRHLDHFDVRSLNVLAKDVPVIIPKDELLEKTFHDLGFSHVTQVGECAEIKFDQASLLTTRSENRVPEYGFIVRDRSGVFWNQVDSIVNSATVQTVLSRVGRVDFLLASWQPMLETSYQFNQGQAFPHSGYAERMRTIGMVKPTALSPGANAFRYEGRASWLNSIVFPVPRERFVSDVKSILTDTAVEPLNPGDVAILENGKTRFVQQASTFVRTIDPDRSAIEFNPVNGDRRMIDDTASERQAETVAEVDAIVREIGEYLTRHSAALSAHRFWGAIYQLDVLCGDRWMRYSYDFSNSGGEFAKHAAPCANLRSQITASALLGMCTSKIGWDRALLGGFYRHFDTVYKATPFGTLLPAARELADPLELLLPYAKLFEQIIANQVKTAKEEREARETVAA